MEALKIDVGCTSKTYFEEFPFWPMWSVMIACEWQADVGSPYQCQPDSHENEVCSDLSKGKSAWSLLESNKESIR
jgi:hypothetical protein